MNQMDENTRDQLQKYVNNYLARQDKINEILSRKDFLLVCCEREEIISKRSKVNPLADLFMLSRIIPKIIGAAEGMGYQFPEEITAAFDDYVRAFNDNKTAIVVPETRPDVDDSEAQKAVEQKIETANHGAVTSSVVIDMEKYLERKAPKINS
jgi:hypothetical protein